MKSYPGLIMPVRLEDFASGLLLPFLDGTSRRVRTALHPAPLVNFVSKPVFLTVGKLGPAKPYLAFVGLCASCYLAARVIYYFWRGVVSYFLAGPLGLGTNLKKLTADNGWARTYTILPAHRRFPIISTYVMIS